MVSRMNLDRSLNAIIDSDLLDRISRVKAYRRGRSDKRLNLFMPSHLFPTISITGPMCALSCKHCEGRLLEGLVPAGDSDALLRIALKLGESGAFGMLVTGGCDGQGRVGIERFLGAIREIKDETDLLVIAHTGFVTPRVAEMLAESGLDGVALDVVGDSVTAKRVYGLDVAPEDYLQSMCALLDAGVDLFPHVCVGLDFGRLSGEYQALRMIHEVSVSIPRVVITALMPLSGTLMAGKKPDPADVLRVVCDAVELFSDRSVLLGCAHSVGRDRGLIEIFALDCGVTNIAVPTMRLLKYAQTHGYDVNYYGTCCGLGAREETRIADEINFMNYEEYSKTTYRL